MYGLILPHLLSSGYITMDRNHNPRVGLVATGERGKVFMNEMHKFIGFGKLHLDQKIPTRYKTCKSP